MILGQVSDPLVSVPKALRAANRAVTLAEALTARPSFNCSAAKRATESAWNAVGNLVQVRTMAKLPGVADPVVQRLISQVALQRVRVRERCAGAL